MSSPHEAPPDFAEKEGTEVLQKAALFARLGYEETARLARIMKLERHPKGALILEQDGLGRALYVVREGEVGVFHTDARGRREALGTLGPGQVFGEMSLLDDALVSADVQVLSDGAQVVAIARHDLEALLEADDRIAAKVYRSFCRALTDRLRRSNEKQAGRGA